MGDRKSEGLEEKNQKRNLKDQRYEYDGDSAQEKVQEKRVYRVLHTQY